MRYLLDTSALLVHYRQEVGWEDVQSIFERGEIEIVVASVSLTEFGRRLCDLGATEAQTETVLTSYRMLFDEVAPIDAATAMAAFLLGSRVTRRLPLVDALIAATAQVKGGVLVHRDEHLRSIPPELVRQKDLAFVPPSL